MDFTCLLLIFGLLSTININVIQGAIIAKEETCMEEHCMIKGVSIIKSMDRSINPCDNFYDFACGGWMEDNDINDDDSTISNFGQLQNRIYRKLDQLLTNDDAGKNAPQASQKAINTYRVCRKLQQASETVGLISLIEEFGGSPLANNFNDKMTMGERLATLARSYAVGPLFKIEVTSNDKDTSKNILVISLPNLPTATGDNEKDKEILQKVFTNTADELKQYQDDYKFVKETTETTSTTNEVDIEVKIKDVRTKLSTKIDWTAFFKVLLKDTKPDGATPGEEEIKELSVTVKNATVIKGIIDHFENNGKLANFLTINFIFGNTILVFPHLNTFLEEDDQSSEKQEMFSCLADVSQYLNHAIDYIFIDKETNSQFKPSEHVFQLISHIKKSFKDLIPKNDWIDADSKSHLLEKLENMNYFVGFPTWIKDTEKLNKYYENLPFPSEDGDKLAVSYANMKKFGLLMQVWKRLFVANRRDEWPSIHRLSVTAVNAYDIQQLNLFALPLSIQLPPFFEEQNPKYLTFGSIGMIVGHEITHGYDPFGIKRGKEGNVKDELMNENFKKEYEKREICFINAYSTYNVTAELRINGLLTKGENVADGGGITIAYNAYKDWLKTHGGQEMKLPLLQNYSFDQLFFISYAQTMCESSGKNYLARQVKNYVHAPNKIRVIGTVSNSKEFTEAFNCPVGSKMNPATKCGLWE